MDPSGIVYNCYQVQLSFERDMSRISYVHKKSKGLFLYGEITLHLFFFIFFPPYPSSVFLYSVSWRLTNTHLRPSSIYFKSNTNLVNNF